MSKQPISVGIVGGGVAGLQVACNLVTHLTKCPTARPVAITLYSAQSPTLHPTYSALLPDTFRLNYKMKKVAAPSFDSPPAADPSMDFFNWVQRNMDVPIAVDPVSGVSQTLRQRYPGKAFEPSTYAPRSLFGHYMAALTRSLETTFQHSEHINFSVQQNTNAEELMFLPDGRVRFTARCQDRASTCAHDVAVLCSSNAVRALEPQRPFPANQPNLFLDRIKASDSIGIMGSSLSAVEVALELVRRGVRDITMYSSEGRLPKVQQEVQKVSLPIIAQEFPKLGYPCSSNLVIGGIIRRQLDALYSAVDCSAPVDPYHLGPGQGADWRRILDNPDPIDQLREELALAASGKPSLSLSFLYSLEDFDENKFWQAMPMAERLRTYREWRTFITAIMAPIPVAQAQEIVDCIDAGFVKLARVVWCRSDSRDPNPAPTPDRKHALRLESGAVAVHDHFVDASGPAHGVEQDPLFMHGIRHGHLSAHPMGGIDMDLETFRAVNPNEGKQPHANLFVVGQHAAGTFPFQTGSASLLRKFVMEAVPHITARLRSFD